MGILRSETMQHGTLVIPTERAVEICSLIGSKGSLMIQDMNAASMRRPYRRYVQRIEEMERMLRLPGATVEKNHVDAFLSYDAFVLDGVEESLRTLYAQFVKFRENNNTLMEQRTRAGDAETAPETIGMPGFSSFAGVVLQADQQRLARTIFRATRGNAFTHVEDLQDDSTTDTNGQPVKRNVFVVYYQGGVGSAMHEKITRICRAFGVETFEWPKSAEEAEATAHALDGVIEDKTRALEAFEEFFFDEVAVLLEPVRPGGNSLIEDWRLFCLKQKAIFGCLNLFEETEATLRADCWFPAEEEEKMRDLLSDYSGPDTVSAFLLSDKSEPITNPPTYIKTTRFSEAFQNIVDTYGVPRYQEANPALLAMVVFPFLFGVMYGDVGHGGIVMLFGLYLVVAAEKLKKKEDEMLQLILYGRYMILLMGCFAIYCGFIYNDFFSLGLNIFGTRYVPRAQDKNTTQYGPSTAKAFPYPFGFDPVWKGADNELDFFNSFKMKLSVIIGFVHMLAGVVLKGVNNLYFRDYLTFTLEFIPQILFFVCLIGYMDFLIVYKWLTPEGNPKPSIIAAMIGMVMLKDVKPEEQFYPNQKLIQTILLILALVSIPWMLLPKPFMEKWAHSRRVQKRHESAAAHTEERVPLGDGKDLESSKSSSDGPVEDEFEMGEAFIHQMIETIEFALGTISNTASYLRLWALSLAHQQLASVFFENIMLMLIKTSVKPGKNIVVPAILIFLGFGAFAAVTASIMLCMDSLECFLHALRLQWVEFQNKFYKADGYKFIPFSFFRILSGLDAD